MGFYGNTWMNEDILEEQQILQEMNFSKKDLQDPKTLDKILKKKEQFESTTKYLSFLFTALGVVATVGVGVGSKMLGSTVISNTLLGGVLSAALVFKINECIESLPVKQFEKNTNKYREKINDLIKKTEKDIEKNPKKKAEYEKIIKNCKEVLAVMDGREKEASDKAFMEEVESYTKTYKELVRWLTNPTEFSDYDDDELSMRYVFGMAKALNIPESVIIDKIKKIETVEDFEDLGYDPGEYDKYISPTAKCAVIYNASDDMYIYDLDKNKMYFISDIISVTSPYKQTYGSNNKKALIEVDKELGYYLLSDCPAQVKKKPFPVKF